MFKVAPLPRTLEAALRDAGHKKPAVRASAVEELGRLATDASRSRVIGKLIDVLREDDSAEVRGKAALALADAEATQAVEALVAAMDDAALEVRQMAIVALGEVGRGDSRALEVVDQALASPSPALRFQGLIAHAALGDGDLAGALVDATNDRDPKIRYIAFRLAEEHFAVDESAGLPTEIRARAREGLDDDDPAVRLAAGIVLVRAGDSVGEEAIVEAVNTAPGVYDPEDEEAAISLAGDLGLQDAKPGLRNRAWGLFAMRRSSFVWQARVALAQLGDRRAKAQILRELGAWTRDTRTLAVAAAGRARLEEARDTLVAMRDRPERADPDAVADALARIES